MSLTERPARCLPHPGENLGKHLVQALAGVITSAVDESKLFEFVIVGLEHLRLESVDLFDYRVESGNILVLTGAKEFIQD
jgi:hypothetical protein